MFTENVDYKVLENGCWKWLHAINSNDYPVLRINGKQKKAYRVSYERHYKVVLNKLDHMHHSCRLKSCINPTHIQKMSASEHTKHEWENGKTHGLRTHCPKGHEFTPENTYIYKGYKTCRLCRSIQSQLQNINRIR